MGRFVSKRKPVEPPPVIQDLAERKKKARELGERTDRQGRIIMSIENTMAQCNCDREEAIERLTVQAKMYRMSGMVVAPLRQRSGGPGLVYFVEAVGTDLVKIGFSRDLARRFSALQAHGGATLRLLAAVPGTEKRERAIHKRFAGDRAHGEWFKRTPQLSARIDRARERHPLPNWASLE